MFIHTSKKQSICLYTCGSSNPYVYTHKDEAIKMFIHTWKKQSICLYTQVHWHGVSGVILSNSMEV